MCEVLAGHVGAEGIRRDARSQRPRDGCTRLHLKRAQTVQSWAGKLCLCVLCCVEMKTSGRSKLSRFYKCMKGHFLLKSFQTQQKLVNTDGDDDHIVGFGLYTGFVDNKKNMLNITILSFKNLSINVTLCLFRATQNAQFGSTTSGPGRTTASPLTPAVCSTS